MIYIFISNQVRNYLPLYQFCKSLSQTINCNTIDNFTDLKEEDLLIIEAPYISSGNINEINCKICIINTESLFTNSYIHFKNLYNNSKIVMVWDYTVKNFEKLKNHPITSQKVFPTYHPSYENKKDVEKEIDVLFYGTMNERRKIIERNLKKYNNINLLFTYQMSNTYNNFFKSKIVLIIHYYLEDFPIDYYRITSLICNKIFIIHEEVQKEDMETEEYRILSETIPFVKHENIVEECKKWLDVSQEERDKIAEKTYQNFKEKMPLKKYIPWEQLKKYE